MDFVDYYRHIKELKLHPKTRILLEKLKNGDFVVNCEGGNSMAPKIKHREPVVLAPIANIEDLQKGDVVYFRSKGSFKTHIIWTIRKEKEKMRFLITNIKGKRGVWVQPHNIFGKVVAVGDQSCKEFMNG